jgi:hypothetical protein
MQEISRHICARAHTAQKNVRPALSAIQEIRVERGYGSAARLKPK